MVSGEESSPLPPRERREQLPVEAYRLPLKKLVKQSSTSLKTGLSQREAEERLKTFLPNVIPRIKPGLFRIYIAPLLNWLINIYLIISTVLAIFALILPEVWTQVVQWLSVIGINAAIAVVQQARAQMKIEALQKLSAPKAKAVRDGSLKEIPAEQLVPGDIIRLEQGDRVPSDARIVTAQSLRVNEASLTGESTEVEKSESDMPVEGDTPIHQRINMVFLGTYVTVGSAKALVVTTGRETQLGRISRKLEELNIGEIPLRQRVNRIAKYLGLAVLVLLSILLAYNMIILCLDNILIIDGALNIDLVSRTIVKSLITAMSIMPINIPLLTTLILVTGVLAMAKHRVVIRNLNVVETLGRISVVCSDKTGTITKNEMTVKWICFPANPEETLYGVTGTGFEPSGEIIAISPNQSLEEIVRREPEVLGGSRVRIEHETPLEYLLVSGLLNNESAVVEEKVKTTFDKREQRVYKALGDTTDASILTLFSKSKLDESIYRSRFQEVRSYPFESRLKRMTRVFKEKDMGRHTVLIKGATEEILARCNSVVADGIKGAALFDDHESLITEKVNLFASSGYRVISYAFKHLNELPADDKTQREFFEDQLTYLGFVAITDPPREGVRQSILEAKGAGIKSVMITGDSAMTAKSIAQQVGIAREGDLAVEGQEIQSLADEEFSRTSVFARVSPEQKMIIADRYKKQNRVVAMTGDGVNDVLAISVADVGISMGITGTDVAKQSADMIIADDSFNSIITGISEGRGIFQKIQSIIFFYIAVNFAEALIYFGSSFIPGLFLLNTWQQIYIFMMAHSIPPFALIIDRISKDVMKERPRDTEGITKQQKVAFLLFSISLALMFYVVYFGTLNGIVPFFDENKIGYIPNFSPDGFLNPANWAQAKARTMLHTVAFIAECASIMSLRRMNKPIHRILKEDNYWIVWVLILLVPLAHLILMYIPEIQSMLMLILNINLDIIHLTWIDWTIAIILGLVPILSLESYKIRMQERR